MAKLVGYLCDKCGQTFRDKPEMTLDLWEPDPEKEEPKTKPKPKEEPKVRVRVRDKSNPNHNPVPIQPRGPTYTRKRYDLCPECYGEVSALLRDCSNVQSGLGGIGGSAGASSGIVVRRPMGAQDSGLDLTPDQIEAMKARQAGMAGGRRRKTIDDEWEIKDGKPIGQHQGTGRVA